MLSIKKIDRKSEWGDYERLFNNAFPEVGNINKVEYDWQFHTYPNLDNHSYEYGAYIDGKLIGYYAAIPYCYSIDKVQTNVGMVCGVMTHSNYRGKGIFTKIGKYSTNDLSNFVPFVTGYPIRKSVIPGHLKVGWKIAFKMPLYVKILRSNAFLSQKKLSFFSVFINPFLYLYCKLTESSLSKNYTLHTYDSFSSITDNISEFIDKWNTTVKNKLVKSKEFLEWRYGRPNVEYDFFLIKKNNDIVSFAACRVVEKMGVNSLCLIDLMFIEDKKAIDILYLSLLKYARANNIEIIMTMMSAVSAKKYRLFKNGFIRSYLSFKLIIKNLTNEFSDEILFNENNWHLMWIDSDDL
jgi:hypothetical protein